MTVSQSTRQFWRNTAIEWAEARLMPPQLDQFKAALADDQTAIAAAVKSERARVLELVCQVVCPHCRPDAQERGAASRAVFTEIKSGKPLEWVHRMLPNLNGGVGWYKCSAGDIRRAAESDVAEGGA